jgi:hypothetical protein
MMDMPRPCQSSNSCCARCSTGSGIAAGPALKFQTRQVWPPHARGFAASLPPEGAQ